MGACVLRPGLRDCSRLGLAGLLGNSRLRSSVLSLARRDHPVEAAVIGGLLVLNAGVSLFQEGRAQKALALLRQQLHVQARALRDGTWTTLPAEELVPGDVIHLRQGSVVPADVRLDEGSLLVDQSSLTGESAAVAVEPGKSAYAGSMVRGGDATGKIAATGTRTFFGKTAELVRTARSVNRQEHEIVGVVRNLFVVNAAMMVILTGYAHHEGLSLERVVPLLLSILLASIPVALPATFTFAAALGSLELSRRGVLLTRLSALHDLASMTVLCSDKTGTLTRNEATVSAFWTAPGFTEDDLLRAAAFASDPAGQDEVDGAIVRAAAERGWQPALAGRVAFEPFDPATKRATADYQADGTPRRYVKGAPAVVARLGGAVESVWHSAAEAMAAHGERLLAVAIGDERAVHFAGLIGLADAVRSDSKAVVSAIRAAGVRTVMVTGDNSFTARNVAEQVGIPGEVCSGAELHGELAGKVLDCGVFAGVLPEDKIKLVRAFQRRGAVVGMSGDGVNDALALRQAEAGLAMANATDVAKAAAAMVLTTPGLGGVVPAIETSRLVFQRIITYTLAMLVKKMEMMALLVAGFLVTGETPLTPLLMVLILFLNDFLTMSITTDRMRPHPPGVDRARGLQAGLLPRRLPAWTLRPRARREAPADADVRHPHLELTGRGLSAPGAWALLRHTARWAPAGQLCTGARRHGGPGAGRHLDACRPTRDPARRRRRRCGLLLGRGLGEGPPLRGARPTVKRVALARAAV
jgi:H+-transporting ATPase